MSESFHLPNSMEISLWIPGWRVLERVGDDLHEEGTTHSSWLKKLFLKCFGFPYQHFGKLDWFSPQLMWRTWEPSHIHHPKFWKKGQFQSSNESSQKPRISWLLKALEVLSHQELFEFCLERKKHVVFCFVVSRDSLMIRVTHIFNNYCTFQEWPFVKE